MKRIRILSVCFASLIIVSCGLNEKERLTPTDSIQKENLSLVSDKTSWFSFRDIITDPKWIYSDDIMWRVEQCQIPDDQLPYMPTDTLVALCANYPFFGDFIFANSIEDGISATMSLFNGFQELQTRPDAADCLISLTSNLKKFTIKGQPESNMEKLRSVYIKLFLSKLISHCFNSQDIEKLRRIINIHDRVDDNYLVEYSDGLLMKSLNTVSKTPSTLETTQSTGPFVQTYFGQNISAGYHPEMSQDQIFSWTLEYMNTYPNAEILDVPSFQYNCHSYAWNISNGGPRCWINSSNNAEQVPGYYTNTDNISPYWTNDLYESTTAASSPSRVFYYLGDHSAVVSQVPGKYESKWGSGPLMRHSPTYCPSIYYPDYRCYFKTRSFSGLLTCSAGIREIQVGETCTYTRPFIDLPYGNTGYTWDVYDTKNEESVLGTYATISNTYTDSNGYNAVITISKKGIYYVRFQIHHPLHDNLISEWEALVTI